MERAVDIITRVGRYIRDLSWSRFGSIASEKVPSTHKVTNHHIKMSDFSAKIADDLPPPNQPSSYLQPQQNNTTHQRCTAIGRARSHTHDNNEYLATSSKLNGKLSAKRIIVKTTTGVIFRDVCVLSDMYLPDEPLAWRQGRKKKLRVRGLINHANEMRRDETNK